MPKPSRCGAPLAVCLGLLSGAFALLGARPALAHHGFAQYDFTTQLEMRGTVEEFEFSQPHSWLTLTVPDKDGLKTWKILMGNPPELTRLGIRPGSFKTGDRISVTVHPMRDGTPGGALVTARGADGRTIGVMPAGIELPPPDVRVKKSGE